MDRIDDLIALARLADRKSQESHDAGLPIPAEVDRLIDAVLATGVHDYKRRPRPHPHTAMIPSNATNDARGIAP